MSLRDFPEVVGAAGRTICHSVVNSGVITRVQAEPMTHVDRTRLLLAGGVVAPLLFNGVILAEGALRPGYEPLHRFGSELALSDRGGVQIANFILTGALVILFSVGLCRAMPNGRGSVTAPVLGGVVGVSLVVGGVFVIDPLPGYPPGNRVTSAPTTSGLIHDLNPFLFYGAFVALAVTMALHFAGEPGGRRCQWFCLVTAALSVTTFGVAASVFDPEAQVGHYHGLWQRISLAVTLGWFVPIAVRAAGRASSRASVESV